MKETVLQLFQQYPELALILSLLLSIVIAVLGLIPSFFITAANILFFGFWPGTIISFTGETIGAAIAFLLYRRGFKKVSARNLERFPKLQRLINAKDKEAFYLVFSLRLLPFVPSGFITFAGAIGKISFLTFLISSSLGKIPALLIEAYSVYQVTQFGWQGKLILGIIAICIIYYVINNLNRKQKEKTKT